MIIKVIQLHITQLSSHQIPQIGWSLWKREKQKTTKRPNSIIWPINPWWLQHPPQRFSVFLKSNHLKNCTSCTLQQRFAVLVMPNHIKSIALICTQLKGITHSFFKRCTSLPKITKAAAKCKTKYYSVFSSPRRTTMDVTRNEVS